MSAIVVGGVRMIIDLAIDFIQFYAKLTDMLYQLEDYLSALAQLAQVYRERPIVQEAVADTYSDLLDFCSKARAVFVDRDGIRWAWTSWRLTFRQQWEPFEAGFGSIKASLQHHVDVLQLARQSQQLSDIKKLEVER